METLVLAFIAILLGLLGLLWGADRFVVGSAGAAKNFGISPLVIGLTIVAMGTSAPEVIVAFSATLQDAGDMAVGNAIGSNLANVGLVLGVTALISPIPIQKHLVKQEGPVLLGITLLAGFFLIDSTLTRTEGIILVCMIPPLLAATVYYKKRQPTSDIAKETGDIPNITTAAAILWFIVGLSALLVSSEALVWGAKEFAQYFGVSQLIIGLTIVAVGTSLPELAASVMSAIRGHHDIALGNIIGSNIFNLLAVMSVPGIIAPLSLESEVFYRDYTAMLLLTLVLIAAIAISLWRGSKVKPQSQISKKVGILLLTLYVLYYVVLMTGI